MSPLNPCLPPGVNPLLGPGTLPVLCCSQSGAALLKHHRHSRMMKNPLHLILAPALQNPARPAHQTSVHQTSVHQNLCPINLNQKNQHREWPGQLLSHQLRSRFPWFRSPFFLLALHPAPNLLSRQIFPRRFCPGFFRVWSL